MRSDAIGHEVLADPHAPRSLARRSTLISLLVAATVIAAGITVVAFRVSRTVAPIGPHATVPTLLPPCRTPTTASSAATPTALGSWPYRVTLHGDFEMIAAADGSLFALEACGAEESSLRVVEMKAGNGAAIASQSFERAAPIASAIGVTGNDVFFGVSRLALGGSADRPPYRLSLVELDPRTLDVAKTIGLGRGYGLSLLPGRDGSLLVATGRSLVEVTSTGEVRRIASFGVVLQHTALVPGTDEALVTLFTPSAVAPAPSTELALVDLATGSIVSHLELPAGDEVLSLAAVETSALVAVSDGESTEVERYTDEDPERRLKALGHARVLPTTLAPVSLLASGQAIFAAGLSTLTCTNASNGDAEASTSPKGAAEVMTGIAQLGSSTYAVTAAGLGLLRLPAACTRI